MSRAKEFEAQREVYMALAELLEASRRDPDGWLSRDLETGQARDPEVRYEMAREVRSLLAEMTRRAFRAEKSLKCAMAREIGRKRRAA